ncbi:MAG: hypothetical protein V2A79_13930, partial [Planctomycetota bacterium]
MKQLHSGLRSELGPEFSDRFMAAVDKAQRDMKSREGVRRPPPRGDTPPGTPEDKGDETPEPGDGDGE